MPVLGEQRGSSRPGSGAAEGAGSAHRPGFDGEPLPLAAPRGEAAARDGGAWLPGLGADRDGLALRGAAGAAVEAPRRGSGGARRAPGGAAGRAVPPCAVPGAPGPARGQRAASLEPLG